MKNIGKMLINARLPYDMTGKPALEAALSGSQVVLLPGVYMLDKQEIDAFTEFVKAGGSLVITGKTGYFDKDGVKNRDALGELAGVRFTGETDEDLVYLSPCAGYARLFPGYNREYPALVNDHGVLVSIEEDVEVLATLALPYSGSKEIYRFGSAISNPPGIWTENPAVTLRKLGKGKTLYVAAPIENEKEDALQAVFAELIKSVMAKAPLVSIKAPSWLEAVAYDDAAGRRTVVSLLPALTQRIEVAARDVEISLKTDGGASKIVSVENGAELPFTEKDGYLKFTVPEVKGFGMYVIT